MSSPHPLENLESLSPLRFFSFECEIAYAERFPKKCKKTDFLPPLSRFVDKDNFTRVALFWNESALMFYIEVNHPFEGSNFPNYRDGDSVELFIDTRNDKSAGFVTKFCHHFCFLPKDVEGIEVKELTRFRTDEAHELCDPNKITFETEFSKKGYQMQIVLPADCLFSYEPESFNQLGFTYRINRSSGLPEHFAVSSRRIAIERHPNLWASLHLNR